MIWTIFILACSVLAAMTLTWWLAVRLHNAGIVDIVWAVAFGALALLDAGLVEGNAVRRAVFLVMVCLWSFRLGIHLLVRVASHHPEEDARYATLRERWGGQANWHLLLFFQMQGLLILILSWPFLLVLQDPARGLNLWEYGGIVLWLISFVGESLADWQLRVFKATPTNRGKVCEVGLWRYSRHPNYFFEWLTWVSLACFAAGSPWGWVDLYAPALMLFFLVRVTGIPMTEAQSIKSKGEAYREYQRRTPSALVPWFPSARP